jgi:hypothetical protein
VQGWGHQDSELRCGDVESQDAIPLWQNFYYIWHFITTRSPPQSSRSSRYRQERRTPERLSHAQGRRRFPQVCLEIECSCPMTTGAAVLGCGLVTWLQVGLDLRLLTVCAELNLNEQNIPVPPPVVSRTGPFCLFSDGPVSCLCDRTCTTTPVALSLDTVCRSAPGGSHTSPPSAPPLPTSLLRALRHQLHMTPRSIRRYIVTV